MLTRSYSMPDLTFVAPRLSRHERFNSEMKWIWDEVPGVDEEGCQEEVADVEQIGGGDDDCGFFEQLGDVGKTCGGSSHEERLANVGEFDRSVQEPADKRFIREVTGQELTESSALMLMVNVREVVHAPADKRSIREMTGQEPTESYALILTSAPVGRLSDAFNGSQELNGDDVRGDHNIDYDMINHTEKIEAASMTHSLPQPITLGDGLLSGSMEFCRFSTLKRGHSTPDLPLSAPRLSKHERFNSEMPWIWDDVPGQGLGEDEPENDETDSLVKDEVVFVETVEGVGVFENAVLENLALATGADMTEMMDDIVKTSRATRQRCYSATEFPMSAPRVSRHERFNSEMPWIWDEVPGQGVDDDVQYEESGVSVKGRSQCEESINPALGFEDDIHRHLLQGDVAVSAEWVDDTVRTLRTASRQRCYSTPDNSLAAPRLSRHERFNSEMPWIWDEIPGQGDDNASSPTTVPEEAFQDADSSDEHHPLFKIQAASPPLGQQDQNHSNTSTPSLSISGLQNPPLAKPLDHSFKCNKTYMEPRTAAYIDFVDIPIPSPSQKTPFPVKDVSTVETVITRSPSVPPQATLSNTQSVDRVGLLDQTDAFPSLLDQTDPLPSLLDQTDPFPSLRNRKLLPRINPIRPFPTPRVSSTDAPTSSQGFVIAYPNIPSFDTSLFIRNRTAEPVTILPPLRYPFRVQKVNTGTVESSHPNHVFHNDSAHTLTGYMVHGAVSNHFNRIFRNGSTQTLTDDMVRGADTNYPNPIFHNDSASTLTDDMRCGAVSNHPTPIFPPNSPSPDATCINYGPHAFHPGKKVSRSLKRVTFPSIPSPTTFASPFTFSMRMEGCEIVKRAVRKQRNYRVVHPLPCKPLMC